MVFPQCAFPQAADFPDACVSLNSGSAQGKTVRRWTAAVSGTEFLSFPEPPLECGGGALLWQEDPVSAELEATDGPGPSSLSGGDECESRITEG